MAMTTLSLLEERRCHTLALQRREWWPWPPLLFYMGEVLPRPLREKGWVAIATLSPLVGEVQAPSFRCGYGHPFCSRGEEMQPPFREKGEVFMATLYL